jgi:hypothetical protein
MRTLGRNMSFFLKCKEVGLKNGVEMPAVYVVIRKKKNRHASFMQEM